MDKKANVIGGAALAAMLITIGWVSPAQAATRDATEYCSAYNVGGGQATVPNPNKVFNTSYGVGTILFCGDGKTWGAVHIELKHTPPDWNVADRCAEKVQRYGTKTTSQGGKTTWKLRVGGPNSFAYFVVGNNGVITNYVTDSNWWTSCANH